MDWDARVAAVWTAAGTMSDDAVVQAIDALVAERQEDDPRALFEAAGARDYAGLEAEAEPLYSRALQCGLAEPERAQAVIQLASTLRNLGRAGESAALLRGELAEHPGHPLADAARAFLALALHDAGEPSAAVQVSLSALAPHLPQYGRAVAAYGDDLVGR
ncbi:tetratricopeptide repeat protein [Leifsonia poae]|nr:tetratricopeptide repeat protein [Leifsonia poae]